MNRVLELFRQSPAACCFSIACGVGVLLSVALLEPSQSREITFREIIGGALLLMPGLAFRLEKEESFSE
jgi:hypothetical protein